MCLLLLLFKSKVCEIDGPKEGPWVVAWDIVTSSVSTANDFWLHVPGH